MPTYLKILLRSDPSIASSSPEFNFFETDFEGKQRISFQKDLVGFCCRKE